VFPVHCFLIRSHFWIFELNVLSDIERLASQKLLFKLFGIDHLGEDSLHLSSTFEQFSQMVVQDYGTHAVLTSHPRLRLNIHSFGSQKNLIEARHLFSLDSFEKYFLGSDGSLLVSYDSMDFSDCEINPLGELILVVDPHPFVDEVDDIVLDVF